MKEQLPMNDVEKFLRVFHWRSMFHVHRRTVFFFIGTCFIGEKYEPIGTHLFSNTSASSPCRGVAKQSSTLSHVVWAGESHTGLGVQIEPLQKKNLRPCPQVKRRGHSRRDQTWPASVKTHSRVRRVSWPWILSATLVGTYPRYSTTWMYCV